MTATATTPFDLPTSTEIAARPTPRHFVGLDGLRGLAILLVLSFHAIGTPSGSSLLSRLARYILSGGWVGVDLFFVLSGFLITGNLIDAKGSSTYMRTFYLRRALRIVPAYAAFVLFVMWVAPSGVISQDAAELARHLQFWYWGYGLNIVIALHGWDAVPVASHLWSLSLEEQFYLLWPVVVLAVTGKTLGRVTLGCIIGAEVVRALTLLTNLRPEANYVLLPERMDTLAMGAFLACALRTPHMWQRVARWMRLASGIAIVALTLTLALHHTFDYTNPLVQLLGFPSIAILAGALVVTAVHDAQWLAHPFLRFCGRYSYAMYLWHGVTIGVVSVAASFVVLPRVLSFAPLRFLLLMIVTFMTTLAIAVTSWFAIESPFLRLKRFVPYV